MKRSAFEAGLIARGVPPKSARLTAQMRARTYMKAKNAGFSRTTGYYGRFNVPGGESKFFDTVVASGATSASGAIESLSLNLIPQGTTESERLGRKCTITSMYIKGQFTLSSTAGNDGGEDRIRVIVYKDKQANGATATVANILETADINSFRNLAESQRFDVLSDRVYDFNVSAATSAATIQNSKTYSFGKAKCNIPLEFNSTTGAITELRSNNIGVLSISESGTANFGFTSRVRFKG